MVQWCSIVSGKHDDCHDQGAVKYGSRPGHDSSRADIVCIVGIRPLPEMLAFFFAFLKDLALEFAFSHFSGICTKNRIFRQLSQLPILFLCGSTCFGHL